MLRKMKIKISRLDETVDLTEEEEERLKKDLENFSQGN